MKLNIVQITLVRMGPLPPERSHPDHPIQSRLPVGIDENIPATLDKHSYRTMPVPCHLLFQAIRQRYFASGVDGMNYAFKR
jgi:hypothetical protein